MPLQYEDEGYVVVCGMVCDKALAARLRRVEERYGKVIAIADSLARKLRTAMAAYNAVKRRNKEWAKKWALVEERDELQSQCRDAERLLKSTKALLAKTRRDIKSESEAIAAREAAVAEERERLTVATEDFERWKQHAHKELLDSRRSIEDRENIVRGLELAMKASGIKECEP